MDTSELLIQRACRIDGALSARAVLDHFNERGRILLGASQGDATARIAQLLAHEADLSVAWGGLPGTDHPRHWRTDVGDVAALSDTRSQHRRLDVHLPFWWALPMAVRDRAPVRVNFPVGLDREQLEVVVRSHMPGGWYGNTVRVILDVETRVYWGARGAVHPQAAARHACAQRSEAGRPAFDLMTLAAGRVMMPACTSAILTTEGEFTLHPGVGWLIAVPVLRFERELTRTERWQLRIARWWHDLRGAAGQPGDRDRDPTFGTRLADDDAWWADQLGVAPQPHDLLQREARLGGSLRPASRAAALPSPATRINAQVIVIHGGLSSVRSGFEAALNTKARVVAKALESAVAVAAPGQEAAAVAAVDTALAAAETIAQSAAVPDAATAAALAKATASATPAAAAAVQAAIDAASRAGDPQPSSTGRVWPGLPLLDDRATWRFEHDTFLGIARNVAHLVAAVGRQCVADAPADASRHVVLIAHSRGGNVARFALPALREAFGTRGWTFAAVTLGSPHLGTHVFERVGHRWHGLATAVGGLRHLGSPWMNRESLAELLNLERGLAYDVPRGFHDVEPAGVERMMRGKPSTDLPDGMWLVGSHWGPGSGLEERAWDWLFEDMFGAEEQGDGLVQRHSALGGRACAAEAASASAPATTAACPTQFDASPVFHTHYLVHEQTRRQVARMLACALDARASTP